MITIIMIMYFFVLIPNSKGEYNAQQTKAQD